MPSHGADTRQAEEEGSHPLISAEEGSSLQGSDWRRRRRFGRLAAMDVNPGQPLSFCNARGERLAGILQGQPAAGIVIACHGMLSNKDGLKHRLLADLLAARGTALLRFDFAGCGSSEGDLSQLSYSQRLVDLAAAIDQVCALGAPRVALFGSSMGGSVAYLAAARDERVVAVASLAAIASPANLIALNPQAVDSWRRLGYVDTERGPIGQGLWKDSLERDVIAAVRVLRIPILVVHGDADEVVPCSEGHDLAVAARTAQLNLVMGADHGFSRLEHLRPAMQEIADFLSSRLQADMPPA